MSMTHKEWMRRCIEECKTCGNLNTASGAERLIEKFSEHMDESAPAVTGEPYQQLVTDENGSAKWVDRTHYKSGLIEVKLNSENTLAQTQSDGSVMCIARNSNGVASEVRTAFKAIGDDIAAHRGEKPSHVIYWDGVSYTTNFNKSSQVVNLTDNATLQMFYRNGGVEISIGFSDDVEHTFGYETFNYTLKRLDEDFMPLLTDANGGKWKITVGTDGTLSAEAVTE